jgi:hypothetical protein
MEAYIYYAIDPDTGSISFIVTAGDSEEHYTSEVISLGFYHLYTDIVPELEKEGYKVYYNFDGFTDLSLPRGVVATEDNVVHVNFN